MMFGKVLAALAGSAVIAVTTVGQASSTPAPSRSACADLGGIVGSDEICEVRDATTTYELTFRFPTDYPDQATVADYLTRSRAEFVDWVGTYATPARAIPYEVDVIGTAYRSGETRSLVLTIGNDTGVHPVTTYKAFNYRLADQAPITFETLFKPGSNPLAVLNPVVRQQLLTRDPTPADDLTAASYQQFAITDDAIIFFFNQDGLLPHEDGPFQVTVPRSELGSLLA